MITPKQIAARIKFPISVEWSPIYVNNYLDAIMTYNSLSAADKKKWKNKPRVFIHKFSLSPGSDDDWDYIKPQYAYIYGRTILSVIGASDLPLLDINRAHKYRFVKQAFVSSDRKALHFFDGLISEKLIDHVQDAYQELAYDYKTVRAAYDDGKVSKEFGDFARQYLKSDKDWAAVNFYVQALNNA